MINTREAEIRDASLALAVSAYDVTNHLKAPVTLAQRLELLEGSFNLSSLIAEAFATTVPAIFEGRMAAALERLLKIRSTETAFRPYATDQAISLDKFLMETEVLESELTNLLAAIDRSKAESFSPKLETTCF